MRHLPRVRVVVYSALAATAAVLAILAVTVYARGVTIPRVILNSRPAGWIASNLGIQYHVGSLRIGCLRRGCLREVSVSGVDAALATPEPFRIHFDNLHWQRPGLSAVTGLEIHFADRPPLISATRIEGDLTAGTGFAELLELGLQPNVPAARIRRLGFDVPGKQVTVRELQFQSQRGIALGISLIEVGGWSFPEPDGGFGLARLETSGLRLNLPKNSNRRSETSTFCENISSNLTLNRESVAPIGTLRPFFSDLLRRADRLLLEAAGATAVLFLVLKLVTLLWLPRWLVRFAFAILPPMAPLVVYFRLHDVLSIRQLLLVTGGVLVAFAILGWVFVYRKGARWFQRWEPFIIDLVAIVVLLPLLGRGYQLPPGPTPPQGLRFAEIQMSKGSLFPFEGPAFEIPQTSISNVKVAFPAGGGRVIAVTAGGVKIAETHFAFPDSTQIALQGAVLDELSVAMDASKMEVRQISARARLDGSIKSDRIQKELRRIEFLRGVDLGSGTISFAVDVRAAGPEGPPRASSQFAASRKAIAMNAAAALQLEGCSATFSLAALVNTKPLSLVVELDGDATHADIRSLRSLPESPLKIGKGSGSLTLGNSRSAGSLTLNLEAIGVPTGEPRILTDSLGISARLSPPGQPEKISVSIEAGPTSVETRQGSRIHLGRATVNFDREMKGGMAAVALESRVEDIRFKANEEAGIESDLPLLETDIKGQTTPEPIPQTFTGAVSFRMLDGSAGNELLTLSNPITLYTNFWQGDLEVPEQVVTIRESVLSETRLEIPLRVAFSSHLFSVRPSLSAALDAQAGISRLEPAIGAAQVTVNDIQLHGIGAWNGNESSMRVSYQTGAVQAQIPPGPSALCMNELSMIDVAASGTISSLAFDGGLPQASSNPSACVSFPSAPEAIRVKLSGVLPPGPQEYALEVSGEKGPNIRIQNLRSAVKDLRIFRGRLASVETNLSALGIQNSSGEGAIDIEANLFQQRDGMEVAATVSGAGGVPLIDIMFSRTPSIVWLDATPHLPSNRILSDLKPFLPQDFDLGGVDLQAHLLQLHAEANLDAGGVVDADVTATFDGGNLASIDTAGAKADISIPTGQSGPVLRVILGKSQSPDGSRGLTFQANLPRTDMRGTANTGATFQANAAVNLEAQGSLLMSGNPPGSPILGKTSQVINELGHQVFRAAGILGSGVPGQPLTNVELTVNLRQMPPGLPAVGLSQNAVQLRLADTSFGMTWDEGTKAGRSHLTASGVLDSTINVAGNQLFLDALFPGQLAFSRGGQPETRVDTGLPIQIAFSERLDDSLAPAGSLWNADYYSRFWEEHPSRFAGAHVTPPVDVNELKVGALSLQQILFPLEPFRAVVGYSGALQLGLPFSGRLMFGSIHGRLESNLKLSENSASLDARLNLGLENIQTAALGLATSGAPRSIVEDEVDGTISLRLDGFILDSSTIAALSAGNLQQDKLGMSIHMHRSLEAANSSGILQSSSTVQIDLLNQILNDIVKDLRLTGPPRAMVYKDMALDFDVYKGQIANESAFLKLGGLQVFSSDFVDVTGEVKAHLGRPGEHMRLQDLMGMFSLPATSTGVDAQ